MSSLYAQYLLERTHDLILETDKGFITYRFLNNDQIYIVDIFIKQEFRKQGYASDLANKICEEAKQKGCKELIGTVDPNSKNATESANVLLAYGMNIAFMNDKSVVFKKEI